MDTRVSGAMNRDILVGSNNSTQPNIKEAYVPLVILLDYQGTCE